MSSAAAHRECLQHDVRGACKLIKWIAREDRANTKSLTVAWNLAYGNTKVLSLQVARLLRDATRAREIVSFHALELEEEERKRRALEQMMGETPKKKKRRSKDVDDSLLFDVPATPISTALRQHITMQDVLPTPKNDDFIIDDLAPPTREDCELLYGLLRSEGGELSTADRTFLDRLSSVVQNETMDFQRASGDFIQNQEETPVKISDRRPPQDDFDFEPHPGLGDILRYGRIPLLDPSVVEIQRRRTSMEDEMEDARHRGHSHEMETPQRPAAPEVSPLVIPRLPSEQIELDEDIILPPMSASRRTPRTPRQTPIKVEPDARHRIPLREMHRIMEDPSELYHKNADSLRFKPPKKVPVKELLETLSFVLPKGCNSDLLEMFPRHPIKYEECIPTNIDSEEEEEEEEQISPPRSSNHHNLDDLMEIPMSQMKFMEASLKTTPIASPIHNRLDLDFDMEMREEPRREERSEHPEIPELEFMDDAILEMPSGMRSDGNSSKFGLSSTEDKISSEIRENMLETLQNASPFGCQLDSILDIGVTSRREAARCVYVALELLKEQKIKATQITPFGPIDLLISGRDSEDLMELAVLDDEEDQEEDEYY